MFFLAIEIVMVCLKRGSIQCFEKLPEQMCAMAILHTTAVLAELRQLCYIRLLLVLMCMDYTV